MRLFISWSGTWSQHLAFVLREWLPLTLQAVEPYMSAEDIDKGARWSSDLAVELEACDYGILCLTPENLEAPWIHFEAGALSKAVDHARVSPFLLGVSQTEVIGPLVQFQATMMNREDVLRLVKGINSACGAAQLDQQRVEQAFDLTWPSLEAQIENLMNEMTATEDKPPLRDPRDILEELLELVRSQSRVLASLEQSRSTALALSQGGIRGEATLSGHAYETAVLEVLRSEFVGSEDGTLGGNESDFDYVLATRGGIVLVEIKRKLSHRNLREALGRFALRENDEAVPVQGLILVVRDLEPELIHKTDVSSGLWDRLRILKWVPEEGRELLRERIERFITSPLRDES